MSSKLFVGALAWATDDSGLRTAFSRFGEVIKATVITDHNTGRSRGFGFVSFKDAQEANAALTGLDGTVLDGRAIQVNIAQDNGRDGGTDDRE